MRKHLVLCMMVLAAAYAAAKPLAAQSSLADSLFYDTNVNDNIATVTVSDFWNASHKKKLGYYPQQTISVPSMITIKVSPLGGTPYMADLNVVAIAEKSFAKAVATSVVFDAPSNVASIGTLAFSSMANMTGKLTLPASLEHLDVSSILLPGITEIEFLGEVPPTCDIAGGYNPWTSATEVTSADIKITIPEGALSAYQDAEGIGDYFTCLKKEDPTSLQDNEIRSVSGSRKVWRGTQLLIEREGVLYNMVGSKVQ